MLISARKSLILVLVLLIIGLITYIGIPFLGLPSVKSSQLADGTREHVQRNCQRDSQKYDWLDCLKLEIEPAHPNQGAFSAYCANSWIVEANIRNSNREILWNNTIEVDSNGNVRSEEYGSAYHPDNWGKPMQNPNVDGFEDGKYTTSSPCL